MNQKMAYTIITKDLVASVNETKNNNFKVTLIPNLSADITTLDIETSSNNTNNKVDI
jgi:hypothetical protein